MLDGSKQKHSLDRHTKTSVLKWPKLYEISGFRPDKDQVFALSGWNAAYVGTIHRRFRTGMLCQNYDKTIHVRCITTMKKNYLNHTVYIQYLSLTFTLPRTLQEVTGFMRCQWMIYVAKQGDNQHYEERITAVIFTLFLPVGRSVRSMYHCRQT
jgi:hypothetical protein